MTATAAPPMTVTEVVQACGVSRQTVSRWMKTGMLRAKKVGGRYRTTAEWLDEFLMPVAETNQAKDRDEQAIYRDARRKIEGRYKIPVSGS